MSQVQANANGTAAMGNSEFDRDTAVQRSGPGSYTADISAGWSIGYAVNGGYLLAVAARALADTLTHPDPFTITAHFLSASRPGPAVIRTEASRPGRTIACGRATLSQTDDDGNEVERVQVLAGYGDLDRLTDDIHTTAKAPQLPPWEHCLSPHELPTGKLAGGPGLMHRIDTRYDPATSGWASGNPGGRAAMRTWFQLADGRDPDPFSLLLAVDAVAPSVFELGVNSWVPTVELTVHVRCRPAPGPLRLALSTRNYAGGMLEEDCEVWDTQDRLVAQSRQLARVLSR